MCLSTNQACKINACRSHPCNTFPMNPPGRMHKPPHLQSQLFFMMPACHHGCPSCWGSFSPFTGLCPASCILKCRSVASAGHLLNPGSSTQLQRFPLHKSHTFTQPSPSPLTRFADFNKMFSLLSVTIMAYLCIPNRVIRINLK